MKRGPFLTKLKANFNDSELRDICFELQIDYENLAGTNKADKARELMLYLDRRDRLLEILKICQQLRPNVTWVSPDTPLVNPNEDSDAVQAQINGLSRRLNKLQEIKALKGIDTEPHYLIELEDIEKELNELLEHKKNM